MWSFNLFKPKSKNLEKLQHSIELMKLKAEKAKYQAIINGKQESKWDKLRKEREDVNNFAEECAEDYQAGGWEKLLENPQVRDFLKVLITKMSSGSTSPNGSINLNDKEKKIMEYIKTLPPEVIEKGLQALKK